MKQGRRLMAKFRIRIEELTLRKGLERGSRITQKEVAEASRVPASTLSRLGKEPSDRIDANTVAKLMKYFECGIGDLIEVVD